MGKVRSWQAREIYWRIGALLHGELMLVGGIELSCSHVL
jgi:hypothetical protein